MFTQQAHYFAQQQALWFAHCMAMQAIAPKQGDTPKRVIYLFNNQIYSSPQKAEIPTPFEADMLLITTNFKKFSTASATTQSEEAVHVVHEQNPTGALFRDSNRRLWVTDYGIAKAIKQRAVNIIKKQGLHESTADQKSRAKTVRDLLRHETVLAKDTSTNRISLYLVDVYQSAMKEMLTTLAEVQHAAKQWRINPTPKREGDYLDAIKWYDGTFERLKIPPELVAHAKRMFDANLSHRKTVKSMVKYLRQAEKAFKVVSSKQDIENRIYGALVEPGITAHMIVDAINHETIKMSTTDSGCCVYTPAHAIELALQCALYGFGQHQPWKDRIIPDSILSCQSFRSKARKCKKEPGTFTASENEKALGIKRASTDVSGRTQLAEMAMSRRQWPKKAQLEKDIKRWKSTVPFNIEADADIDPRFSESIKKKSLTKFSKAGDTAETYKPLYPLYKLLFEHRSIRSWHEFVKFMLTSAEASQWLEAYFAKLAVAYKENQRKVQEKIAAGATFTRDAHALVGGTADAMLDVAAWLLKHGKRDKEWLALLQDATPAFLSRWFSLRETTVWLFQVLSQADWEWLLANKNQASMHKLWFGLFVIVTEDGYRLVKRENKGRSGEDYRTRDDQADFDITDLSPYPFLEDYLDMAVDAIEKITGYRLTYESRQPEVYISMHQRTKGLFQLLQAHIFPFRVFEHGNKHCLTAKLKHVGKIMAVHCHPEQALPPSETRQHIWQSQKRGAQLAKIKTQVCVDGETYDTTLGKCRFAFIPREELYLPFYDKNKSTTKKMHECFDRLYTRIKSAIKTQPIHGQPGLISGKPMNQKSLALSSILPFEFTSCGRHGSGNRHIESKTYYSKCDDPDVKTKLKGIVRETIKRESHINENVVAKNYLAFKGLFKDFASLKGNIDTDRWSSHPHQRPSADTFPWTFVEPQHASGSLKSRSKHMAQLTIDEQNAQLFWFANLELVWQHRALLDGFCCSKAWEEFAHTMDAALHEAQAKWDVKFGKTWTESAVECVKGVVASLSPGKRPRDETTTQKLTKRIRTEPA